MTFDRSVVITGLGAVSPPGIGVRALWDAVREGIPCGGSITRFDASAFESQIAAECNFDPYAVGLSEKQQDRMDRSTQFAVVAAREALQDSQLLNSGFDSNRLGIFMGTAIGGVGFMENVFRKVCLPANGKPKWITLIPDKIHPNIYPAFLAYSVSNEIARALGLRPGVCSTMATGCSAGLDAIGAAADAILCGMADVMITGGVDAPITPIVVASFDVIGTLSRHNEAPRKASRPFDKDRDGFLLSEGCAVVILEEEHHAKNRGARILGRLLGFASRSNAYHMTGLPAHGIELAETISIALKRAGIVPEDVDYVNAHGSSTQQNDQNETAAFKRVFGKHAYDVPISSTKSVIGHTLGAASALETVVCICALQEGIVPPTANYETPCAECDLDYVPNKPRKKVLRVIECNASSFSGIHSSAIFGHCDYSPNGGQYS